MRLGLCFLWIVVASSQECGMSMAGKHVFTYFDVPSRGEAARIALHAAGVDYEDKRLNDWAAYQAAKAEGKYPTGVPTLELPSGRVMYESFAIARYAARCRVDKGCWLLAFRELRISRVLKVDIQTRRAVSRMFETESSPLVEFSRRVDAFLVT